MSRAVSAAEGSLVSGTKFAALEKRSIVKMVMLAFDDGRLGIKSRAYGTMDGKEW